VAFGAVLARMLKPDGETYPHGTAIAPGATRNVNIQLVCVRSLVVTLGHLLWIGSSGYWLVAVWVDGMVR